MKYNGSAPYRAGSRMTLKPFDVIVFVPSPWLMVKSLPENTVLELVRRGHRVLVVEPLNSIASYIRNIGWLKKPAATSWGMRQAGERVWVLSPPPLGVPGVSRSVIAATATARLLAIIVARAAASLGFEEYAVWTYQYNSGPALKALPASFRIYECGDNDVALARNDLQRRTVEQMEERTCKAADLVICCSDELNALRSRHNPHTHPVYCAADAEFFAAALLPSTTVPADIAKLRHPVIGYMGGMDPWKIDIALVAELARRRPDWSFAFIGFVWFGFDRGVFSGLENIHILGPRDYDAFPAYLKGIDVGIMPFPLNDITRYGDALKCYEYMAAGLPVVSRPVPVALRLKHLVRVASSAGEFISAIELALKDDPAASVSRSKAIAEAHTWRHRVGQKLDLIASLWNPAAAAERDAGE